MRNKLFNFNSMLIDIHSHIRDDNYLTIVNKSDSNVLESDCFSFGIHPWNASEIEDNFLNFENEITSKKCLAIGEIGLDKLKGPSIEIQKKTFLKQIEISEKYELPIIIHCVKSWNEIFEIKKSLNPKQTWIFHGFNKVGILNEVLKSDVYISIGSSILTNIKLQEIVNLIPNNRLFLETDDSNLDIFEIYKKVSEIKKIPLSELEQIIEQNFKRVFRKWQSG